MNNKYQNRYRISSTRLQKWNYSWNGGYFITICTQNREHFFGEINNNIIHLSKLGIIADILWYEIKNHFYHIELEQFVVMPNHFHGIFIINDPCDYSENNGNISVKTRHALSLQPSEQPQPIGQQRFQNQGKNTVSSIIGSYKSAVTKHAHRLGFRFKWQSNYWEHIIRNENEYNRIARYIINNPLKWGNDKLNGGDGNIIMESPAEYNYENWMI